jgi:hypothetical protein
MVWELCWDIFSQTQLVTLIISSKAQSGLVGAGEPFLHLASAESQSRLETKRSCDCSSVGQTEQFDLFVCESGKGANIRKSKASQEVERFKSSKNRFYNS